MNLSTRYFKNKTLILLSFLAIFIGVIIVGYFLAPTLFYDHWIWKHYWGPIVADADPTTDTVYWHGVSANEGYTLIAEITYGVIVVIALYGIYKLLKKLKIEVDWRFTLALLPFILFGSISRVLEDSGYFTEPLVYWFISPLIYLQIAAYALSFLLFGYYIERKFKKRRLTINTILFLGGLFFLLPSLYLISKWIMGEPWQETTGIHFYVLVIVISIASSIVGLIYFLSWKFGSNEKVAVYKNPLNLFMIFGHLVDGLTSYISIKDPLNMGLQYTEKHPLSDALLNIWGPLFPIVKFLLIIIVIYVLDVVYKNELKNYMSLLNILKIGILILGLSPGIRDLLRVAMGV